MSLIKISTTNAEVIYLTNNPVDPEISFMEAANIPFKVYEDLPWPGVLVKPQDFKDMVGLSGAAKELSINGVEAVSDPQFAPGQSSIVEFAIPVIASFLLGYVIHDALKNSKDGTKGLWMALSF